MLAVAVGDQGEVVGVTREPVAIRLDAEAHARARERGLRYGLRIPFKEPGGYQIRVAVQDGRSKALGTGAQLHRGAARRQRPPRVVGRRPERRRRGGRSGHHDVHRGKHGRVPDHRVRRPWRTQSRPDHAGDGAPRRQGRLRGPGGVNRGRGEGRATDRAGALPRHADARRRSDSPVITRSRWGWRPTMASPGDRPPCSGSTSRCADAN